MLRKLVFPAGALSLLGGAPFLAAQQPGKAAAPKIARIEVRPATLTLGVNDTATITAAAYDSSGARLDVPLAFFSFDRRSVGVDSLGRVRAYRAGHEPVRVVAVKVAVGFAT